MKGFQESGIAMLALVKAPRVCCLASEFESAVAICHLSECFNSEACALDDAKFHSIQVSFRNPGARNVTKYVL